MSDKVIKCNSCGFPLEASSASQRRIKCPKCGVVNVIETPRNASAVKYENVFGGVPVTADSAALHKNLVFWICKKHETTPADLLQELELTSVDKLSVPCYLFECNATIRYSYKIGNKRERMKKVDNDIVSESYIEYTHQNDVFDYNDCILVSGNAEVAKHIQALYSKLDVSELVDVDRLVNPPDVQELSLDVQPLNALPEVKEIIGKSSDDQIKKLLKGNNYKDLQIRDNFRVDYGNAPKLIFLPLIHVTYQYKDQTGDIWFSGDSEYLIANDFPKSDQFERKLKEVEMQRPNFDNWGLVILCFISIILIPLGLHLIDIIDNKNREIDEELAKLRKEHVDLFTQSSIKQIPLKGVLHGELRGNPDAFPDLKDLVEYGLHS